MIYSIVIASNNDEVLNSNILNSPNISEHEIIVKKDYKNICKAYNEAMKECTNDIVIFVHQDVYLPNGFFDQLTTSINSIQDKDWAILGVAGIDGNNKFSGYVNDRGNIIGDPNLLPNEANTLDELMLVLKKDSYIFDENIINHHLFGTDVCLQARYKGKKNYTILAFCHHNSTLGGSVPPEFHISGNYIKSKWKDKFNNIISTCGIL